MIRWLATLFLFATCAHAGLPPTSSQGVADANKVTTFNFHFPSFSVTHTGVDAYTDLNSSGVTAGVYTNATVTVNAKGIVTGIASGSSSGGSAPVVQVKTTNYTLLSTDTSVNFNTTTTATAILPDCTGLSNNWIWRISNMNTGLITITAGGSNTFSDGLQSGLTTYQLTDPGASVTIDCNQGSVLYVHQ